MPTNIYCENEECTHCIDGICHKQAVKINYRGKCESLQVKEPGGDYEQEKV